MPKLSKLQYCIACTLITGLSHLAYADPLPSASASVFAGPNAPSSTPVPNLPSPSSNFSLHPVPPQLNVNGYYLQDIYSEKVLAALNPDQKMEPASLTKLMTLYIAFEALQAGRIHMDDAVPVSEDAWRTGGSRMFIKPGDHVTVGQLIDGVIIDSGNDACVALAEYVGGTEDSFVGLMNEQAKLLGMNNSHFMDCTGLPNPNHYTTPHDLGILTRAIIFNFPQYYPLFSQKTFTYNNITQPNRNRLLWRDPTVDGLKTGHTDEAGYCLISSADRNGMRLISVLLGAPTDEARAQYSEDLLNYGYRFYETHKVYSADTPIENVPVYYGKVSTVPLGVSNDFYVTTINGQYKNVQIKVALSDPLKAPITRGEKIGDAVALLNNQPVAETEVVALSDVPEGGLFSRMVDRMKLAVNKV